MNNDHPPARIGPALLACAACALAGAIGLDAVFLPPIGESIRIALAGWTGFAGIGAALLWWRIGHHARLAHRTARIERTIEQLDADIAALNAQLNEQNDLRTEHIDTSESIRSELRMLQTLLAQVGRTGTARAEASRPHDVATPIVRATPNARILTVMRSAIEDSRVDLYLQPIVRLPSRKTLHYEAFSRVRDENGIVIFPLDYLTPAADAGMVATLDNLLLFRCINLIRKLGPRRPQTRIFVNLARGSLHDPAFMRDFVGFMIGHRALAERLVFELSANMLGQLPPDVSRQLAQLARAGFPFSIDQVTDLDLDLPQLASYNVQFVKVEAAQLLAAINNNQHVRFRDTLARANIALIATHIETESTVVEILEVGVSLGQGYLFSPPKPTRQDFNTLEAPGQSVAA